MRGISYCRSVPLRLEGRARSAEAAHCSRWRRELLAQIGVGRKESEKPAVANLTGECCYFHAAMNPQRTFQELHAMRPSNVTLRALRAVCDCSAHIVYCIVSHRASDRRLLRHCGVAPSARQVSPPVKTAPVWPLPDDCLQNVLFSQPLDPIVFYLDKFFYDLLKLSLPPILFLLSHAARCCCFSLRPTEERCSRFHVSTDCN